MSLKCGIVGLPNVGKSTLFNALSGAGALSGNFPFCTIEPNVGIVNVPNYSLYFLANLVVSDKVIPASIEFVDIAGLVKGASQGEGLGNQFLANIREVDLIVHVIRCFKSDDIVHVAGSVDPVFDKEVIEDELRLKDLETLKKHYLKVDKVYKSSSKDDDKELHSFFKELISSVEGGISIRDMSLSENHLTILKPLGLLTMKKVLYVANVDEVTITNNNGENEYVVQLKNSVGNSFPVITVCASLEDQIRDLDMNDRQEFISEYGLKESGLEILIRYSYDMLGLITYFTAGPKETRAWTIARGMTASEAAGVIHTDFEKGFIKAEVIKYNDYINYGSEAECRKHGKVNIEGRDYIVEDNDIMNFKFKV